MHHVIIRGIGQGCIVRDDTGRNAFPDRLGKQAKGSETSIYAFALMTNHAHILLKTGQEGLQRTCAVCRPGMLGTSTGATKGAAIFFRTAINRSFVNGTHTSINWWPTPV